jgi:hypothetical protein
MKATDYMPKFMTIIISALLVMSCLLPGMIPLTPISKAPMPTMEKNADKVIEILTGQDWQPLQGLAQEQYTEEDLAKPGTLTFTVNITDDKPTYFNYGWCAVDEETLRQNFEHIDVRLYINDDELGKDVVHNLTFTSPDNLLCVDFGVLILEWAAGEYKLEAVATFDEKINDGLADYEAGEYIFMYNVTVEK